MSLSIVLVLIFYEDIYFLMTLFGILIRSQEIIHCICIINCWENNLTSSSFYAQNENVRLYALKALSVSNSMFLKLSIVLRNNILGKSI